MDKDPWQPIETAPNDSTWVILSDGEHVTPGYWGNTYFGWDPDWVVYSHRSEHEPISLLNPPTHWMPLPGPPEASE